MPILATFSDNVWVPHSLHTFDWTISTFYIALFSEKCNMFSLNKAIQNVDMVDMNATLHWGTYVL